MKLHLPVTKVEQDIMTRGGKVQRFKVTLSDGYDSIVQFSTSTQPAVGQMMIVEITKEETQLEPDFHCLNCGAGWLKNHNLCAICRSKSENCKVKNDG